MKTQFTYIFYINLILLFLLTCSTSGYAQDTKATEVDTLIYKQNYGLRLGFDLSKIVRTLVDDNYTGFEIMGDYRITKKLYIAGEIGNEERTLSNAFLTNTTKGSYLKGGVDINFYKNWLDMENMIYAGFRVGASTFSQTLDNYTVYDINNQYWGQQFSITEGTQFSGLTAFWIELQLGYKAEVLHNLYVGANLQLKGLVSQTKPNNYENLYIPGFNRTYDSGRFGSGYGVNIAYLVPIYKKDKIVVKDDTEEQ